MLKLWITTQGQQQNRGEHRLDSSLSVSKLKDRLHLICGIAPQSMRLRLFDRQRQFVGALDDETARLHDYRPEDYYEIEVGDVNGSTTAVNPFADGSASIDKREMTEEEYAKRPDSARKWLEHRKLVLARDNPHSTSQPVVSAPPLNVRVGDRCQIDSDSADSRASSRRGTVCYIGSLPATDGHWIGVALDEPVGKHDGLVKGHRYFTCQQNHGLFVRPNRVHVGNFLELLSEELDEL